MIFFVFLFFGDILIFFTMSEVKDYDFKWEIISLGK